MTKKNVTPSGGDLSASQHDAIRLLVSGCTAKYTALVLKVNYADVKRWMQKDSRFQSELAAQVEKREAQSSQPQAQSSEKRMRDEKNRRGDYEGDETLRELASN